MAIDVRRFVNVNIKPHLTSAIEGTRKTVVLYTNEATPSGLTSPFTVEAADYESTCALMPNTLIYLHIFFGCGGSSVKIIADTAVADIPSIDIVSI